MENSSKTLAEIYAENNTFGNIILSPDEIEIQGKKVASVIPESVKFSCFGNKTIVTCSFICDEFSLIPSDSSD